MRNEFQPHLLNDDGRMKVVEIGDAFSDCLARVEAVLPIGRERSLVVTKLQEASFFANKGIAIDPANQK